MGFTPEQIKGRMNSFKCCGEHIRRNTRMQQKLIMSV